MISCRPLTLTRLLATSVVLSALTLLSACSMLEQEPETDPIPETETIATPAAPPLTPTTPSEPPPTAIAIIVPVQTPTPLEQIPVAVLALASGEESTASQLTSLLNNEEDPLNQETVGYYMDVQYANLQQKLSGNLASIRRRSDEISIVLSGSMTFKTDSSSINQDAEQVLSIIADVLSEYNKTLIIIEGHADAQGDDNYNQLLSERRALSIGNYLTDNEINLDRLFITAFGSSRPLGDNQSIEGREQNRRIQLTLKPVVSDPGNDLL